MVMLKPVSVYADEGDFYDKHKERIDKEVLNEDYEYMIKHYDYDTNRIDCGMTKWVCKINAPITTGMIGLIKGTWEGFDNLVIKTGDITSNTTLAEYKNALGSVAQWMLALFLIWSIVKIISLRLTDFGDGGIAMNEKVVVAISAGIILACYTDIVGYILRFQYYIIDDLIDASKSTEDIVLATFLYGAEYGFVILMILCLAIGLFSITFIYRFALFATLYAIGVLAVPTMLNDEYNYFSIWLRTFINNGVTFFAQMFAFMLGVKTLTMSGGFTNHGMASELPMALAFFAVALAVPGILGQLGAGTGAGRSVGSGAKTVVRMITRR